MTQGETAKANTVYIYIPNNEAALEVFEVLDYLINYTHAEVNPDEYIDTD